MPKRKSEGVDSPYEYLVKKIKRLDKKLKKQERDRRSRSRSSRSHSRHTPPPRSSTPPRNRTPPPPPLTPQPLPPPLTIQPPPLIEMQPQPLLEIQPPPPPLTIQSPPQLPAPPPTAQPETPSPATTSQTENKEEQLPEELLLALGHEGEDQNVTGEPITNELAHRWTKIMNEGLTKEQREALLEKYNLPSNFKAAIPPILNKEIAATLSDLSLNRDKRIIARQKMTGKLLTCLGKTLSEILKGNINNKNIIQEISDAAKMASEIYYNDNKSRKFFALSNASKAVQEACKDAKTDTFLFGEALSEQIKSVQAVKRTAAQISDKLPSTSSRHLNWRGPPQYQSTSHRGRGGQRPTRRPPVTQTPHRPAAPRGKYAPRRGNQRRY